MIAEIDRALETASHGDLGSRELLLSQSRFATTLSSIGDAVRDGR